MVTGYHNENKVPGQSTRFLGFAVSEPEPLGTDSGVLEHGEDGAVKLSRIGPETGDFMAVATFTNPDADAGPWDYGFIFRESGQNVFKCRVRRQRPEVEPPAADRREASRVHEVGRPAVEHGTGRTQYPGAAGDRRDGLVLRKRRSWSRSWTCRRARREAPSQ